MNAAVRAKWRKAGIVLVVAAPIVLYTVWRVHSAAAVGFVWAEVTGAPPRFEYQPRNAVFDSSRKQVSLSAARGERVSFVVRLVAKVALASVQVSVDPLPLRQRGSAIMGKEAPAALVAHVRSVVRAPGAAEGEASFAPMAPLPLMAARTATEWLVEVAVPHAAKPGSYGGLLYVRAGDVGIERLLVSINVAGAPLGGCAPVGSERLAVWREPPAIGPAPARGVCDDTPPATLSALRQELARGDRRYLDLLRARKDAVVEGLVARVLASPPATAEAWALVRSELIGLLNAPGPPQTAPAK